MVWRCVGGGEEMVNTQIAQYRGGYARVIAIFCGMQFKLSRSIRNVLFLLTQWVELG